MRLLVIGGASGQVAGALAALDGKRARIVALGRPDADLSKPETLAAALDAHEPDAIVCAGAYTAVDKAESDPATAQLINASGPAVLAEMAAARGVPILLLSTDYVFDGAKSGPYVESDVPHPTGVYGQTKLAGELRVAAANARHVILRTAWVYAAHGGNFVRAMLRLAKAHERLGVVDDQRGCPSYAPHVAESVLAITRSVIEHPSPEKFGVFHMTGGGACSRREFAEAIFAASRIRGGPSAEVDPISTQQYPTPARRPANSVLNCNKLAATHGVFLPHWRVGLDACLDTIAIDGWRVDDV